MKPEDLIARIRRQDPAVLDQLPEPAVRRLVRATWQAMAAEVKAMGDEPPSAPVAFPGFGRIQPPKVAGRPFRLELATPKLAVPTPTLAPLVVPPVAAKVGPFAHLRNAQRAEPVLVHPDHKFVLIFSPKSACSSVVIWFFHTLGLADEARAFDEWPHNYRIQKLMRSPEQQAARKIPLNELKVLRVVRDPVDRAGSSFRHALGTGYANEQIQLKLGVDIVRQGLSFQRFIDFLEAEDLDNCNPHHRRQKHPVETQRAPDFVINASRQDLFAGLNAFERQMGMPKTDFAALRWIHELQATRVPHSVDMGGHPDRMVLTREQAQRGPWPQGLITPAARARLEALYAEDIQLYAQAAPLL
jgi:hypothetical protein